MLVGRDRLGRAAGHGRAYERIFECGMWSAAMDFGERLRGLGGTREAARGLRETSRAEARGHRFLALHIHRVVRMVCEEKGIDYALTEVELGAREVFAIHSFGKMPAMRHGDVELFESKAIASLTS
jgi:hypothetical protein